VTEEEKREKESRMYSGVETFNPFCGCHFSCSFCYAQRIAKRQKHRCERCYKFAPHAHPERLSKKFKPGDNIFVCSMGDISYADINYVTKVFDVVSAYPKATFMFQSKNPLCFIAWRMYFKAPDNCVLGTTIETNRSTKEVSKAPDTEARKTWLSAIRTRKYVTIEPIMDFDHNVMVAWIKEIRPEFVYIGYNSLDSKNKHLLEPTVTKTKMLIASLEEVTEVRQKKIRPAWDETVNNV
jgi:protein gp37